MGQRNYVNGFTLTIQEHMLELPLVLVNYIAHNVEWNLRETLLRIEGKAPPRLLFRESPMGSYHRRGTLTKIERNLGPILSERAPYGASSSRSSFPQVILLRFGSIQKRAGWAATICASGGQSR